MKKYISILVLMVSAITFASAQNAAQEKRVNRMMNDLQQACQLTPDESSKVQPMVQNFVSISADNKQKYAGDKVSLRSANETNRKNLKANLATVLSADQLKQYEQYLRQRHQNRTAQPANNTQQGQ